MLKIRRSHDRLIFNMGISIPGKDGLYIETGPRLVLCLLENDYGYRQVPSFLCRQCTDVISLHIVWHLVGSAFKGTDSTSEGPNWGARLVLWLDIIFYSSCTQITMYWLIEISAHGTEIYRYVETEKFSSWRKFCLAATKLSFLQR